MVTMIPVTNREFTLADRVLLVFATDPDGCIRYANPAFLQATACQMQDLLGQASDLLRHPDMPADTWATIWHHSRADQPWTAVLKIRRLDGDHCWLKARALPTVQDERLGGFLVVCTRPVADERLRAEQAYRTPPAEAHAGRDAAPPARSGLSLAWRLRAGQTVLCAMSLSSAHAAMGGRVVLALVCALGGCATWRWLETSVIQPLQAFHHKALTALAGQGLDDAAQGGGDELRKVLRLLDQAGQVRRELVDDVAAQLEAIKRIGNTALEGADNLGQHIERAAAGLQSTASAAVGLMLKASNNAELAARTVAAAREGTVPSSASLPGGAQTALLPMAKQLYAELADNAVGLDQLVEALNQLDRDGQHHAAMADMDRSAIAQLHRRLDRVASAWSALRL